jgi:hypothetical protein
VRSRLFVNGAWADAASGAQIDVINPATETALHRTAPLMPPISTSRTEPHRTRKNPDKTAILLTLSTVRPVNHAIPHSLPDGIPIEFR